MPDSLIRHACKDSYSRINLPFSMKCIYSLEYTRTGKRIRVRNNPFIFKDRKERLRGSPDFEDEKSFLSLFPKKSYFPCRELICCNLLDFLMQRFYHTLIYILIVLAIFSIKNNNNCKSY